MRKEVEEGRNFEAWSFQEFEFVSEEGLSCSYIILRIYETALSKFDRPDIGNKELSYNSS